MTADPGLTAIILVAIVGTVAIVMSASSDWEVRHELARETDRWTAPLIVRRYDAGGRRRRMDEAAVLQAHGYTAVMELGGGDGAFGTGPDARGHEPDGPITITYARE